MVVQHYCRQHAFLEHSSYLQLIDAFGQADFISCSFQEIKISNAGKFCSWCTSYSQQLFNHTSDSTYTVNVYIIISLQIGKGIFNGGRFLSQEDHMTNCLCCSSPPRHISEIGYLLLPSRDMAKIPLKRCKSSILTTNLCCSVKIQTRPNSSDSKVKTANNTHLNYTTTVFEVHICHLQ